MSTGDTILIALVVAALSVTRSILDGRRRPRRLFDFLGQVEVGVITLMLVTLVFIGATQIVLRNVAHTGILWAEPLMRHIVLWLGCFGAMLATARMRHINIDVLTRVLPDALRPARDAVVYGATALAAFALGVAALRLVIDERAFGDVDFMGIPTWVLQSVLPFAFFLISYRSLVNLWLRRHEAPQTGKREDAG